MKEIHKFHEMSSWDTLKNPPNTIDGNATSKMHFKELPKIKLNYNNIPEKSFSKIIQERYTAKEISPLENVSIEELGTFLKWSVGTRINDKSKRVYPSAGGSYPNHIFIFIRNNLNIDDGLYWYDEKDHSIVKISSNYIYEGALLQDGIDANLCFVIASDLNKSQEKYGLRGYRFSLLEAGHISQNMLHLANVMGWKSTPIGGFRDEVINNRLPNEIKALFLIPVGK
jgi:SagB-type dehydrogenase family enzyme